MNRRSFLQSTVAGALAPGLKAQQPPAARTLGIQIGAVSFADEGVEKVLDTLQQSASINTIFLATFTYGRGIAGRQLPSQPLPDHGKQQYDADTFHGGNYATPRPQYYRNTALTPEKAPDHPGYDVVADVLPAAHRRGMKVICWFEDVLKYTANIAAPGFDRAQEVVLAGPASDFACSRNPHTRNFWLGLVEDYLRS